ncbi:MAG TPA: BMP family ABC transporter substrate-binding protein [Candidatus Wallbacteria bacterium]|nr:MAG: Membrane lipoprotein TmpC precursor [bacterium ADurb.Bin243]HPG57215.1 BMP family ABC transporter substrate-binding protein [Candidatus Wallbacteria bacterium]
MIFNKKSLKNGNIILTIIIAIIAIIIFTFAYRAYLGLAGNAYSKCAVFLARGGGGDKGFNDLVTNGLHKIEKDMKVELNFNAYQGDDKNIQDASFFAKQKYDLLIGVGFEYEELFSKLSRQFKNTHFVIIDSAVTGKNTASLIFREHEGGFLAGAFAALVSKGKPVGFIGGMMIPPVERFSDGFVEGAKHINPKIKVEIRYVGKDPSAFANKAEAKKLALQLYKSGVQIIFHAAGGAGLGVIEAAVDAKRYVIGVDSDQSALAPGNVITSVEKRLDVVIYDFLKSAIKEGFKSGKRNYGVKEGAIRLSSLDYSKFKVITPEVESRLDKIQKDIIEEKIGVLKSIKKLYD